MPAAPASDEDLDELSCPICFELFVDPRTPKNLPCGHVYCEKCLKQMVKSRACPECKQKFKIPAGGISSFATNFRLRRLAENHLKAGSQLSPKKTGGSPCADHGEEEVYFYCVTCNSLACQVCLILRHIETGHKIEDIKAKCSTQKKEIKTVVANAKSRMKKLTNVLNECKEAKIQNSESLTNAEWDMDEYTKMRINELLDKAEALNKQLESFRQCHESSLKEQTSSLEKQIHLLKTSCQAAENATENLPDHEYITQHTRLVKDLEENHKLKTPRSASHKMKQDVKFVRSRDSSQTKLGHFIYPGKVRTLNQTQTLDGFTDAWEVACTSELLAVVDYDGMMIVIYHEVNGKYEKKLNLNLSPENLNRPKPCGIAICRDGRLMVARHTRIIEVYSSDGNHQNDIKIKESNGVEVDRVVVSSDGRILVGEYHGSLMEIDPKGKVIKTIQTRIKPNHLTLIHNHDTQSCTHIAISNDHVGKIIVIDIETGQETLSIDVPQVVGICYDEHTECLLAAKSEPADESGRLRYKGVIEQYSLATGELVACLQQGLYSFRGMVLSSEGYLIIANQKTVEVYEIQ